MKERVIFIIKYYFSIVTLSVIYKAIFLFIDCGDETFTVTDTLYVCYHGLSHDFAIAGYFSVIPLIVSMISLFVNFRWKKIFIFYNGFTAFVLTLAFLADLTLYPYWEFKLDASVLMYLDSPTNAFASISVMHFILLALFLCAGTYGIFRILMQTSASRLHKACNRLNPLQNNRWVILTLHILIGGLLFLGIRGGISESTNNIGTVYFSNRNILNYAAVNPAFSFLYSFAHREDFSKEYHFFEEEERMAIFETLYPQDCSITDTLLNNQRPNIITIIFEGLSAELVEELGGMKNVTPNFNRIAKEGVLFTNCYANSYRTDRGLICALSGYPSFPKTSVMKSTAKSQELPSFASSLAEAGYRNTFLYGGDINFTNMRGYLYSTGYNQIIADKDFSTAERSTHRWGAGDDVTFSKLYDIIMQQDSAPWHITFLTLSSHEPWSVPYSRIDNDKIANSFAFADEEFGKFFDKFKDSDKWGNTLIICISDHSVVGYPKGITQADKKRNRIPLLLTGGAIKEPKRIETICNQQDFVATILPQLGMSNKRFPFSRNVLSSQYIYPFAYHCFNNGFSIIDSAGFTVYDLDKKESIHNEPSTGGEERERRGKAILQTTYSDFYNK